MYSEDSVSGITADLSHVIGLPENELIQRGLVSFIEKEIRLAEADIADLIDRYNVAMKEICMRQSSQDAINYRVQIVGLLF
ncbi:hypothetical protein ig2599ANME_1654 [groundwater metagenome]